MEQFFFGNRSRIKITDDGYTIELENPSGKAVAISVMSPQDMLRVLAGVVDARERLETHIARKYGEPIVAEIEHAEVTR